MTTGRLIIGVSLLAAVAACDFGSTSIDTCIDGRATIHSGFYGQLLNGCDTENCAASYAVGMELRVYDTDPTPADAPPDQGIYDTGTDLTPVRRVLSGSQGFYQVTLSPGTWYLCTNNCTKVTLSKTPPRIRLDWASGPGGGNWWEGASCTGR